MNVRDVHPQGATILAVLIACPLFFYTLAGALLSRDPIFPEPEWHDGNPW